MHHRRGAFYELRKLHGFEVYPKNHHKKLVQATVLTFSRINEYWGHRLIITSNSLRVSRILSYMSSTQGEVEWCVVVADHGAWKEVSYQMKEQEWIKTCRQRERLILSLPCKVHASRVACLEPRPVYRNGIDILSLHLHAPNWSKAGDKKEQISRKRKSRNASKFGWHWKLNNVDHKKAKDTIRCTLVLRQLNVFTE